MDEGTEKKEANKSSETYCPWCVGTKKSLEHQRAGQTTKTCEKHMAELQAQLDKYFPETPKK